MADDTSSVLPHEQPAPPRVDLWIALVFFVFAVAAAWLAFAMPTYTNQKGEIYTAPGLVPAFYSIVMMLLSIWLGVRAVRQGALRARAPEPAAAKTDKSVDIRLALAAGICLFFIVGLLGRMPFWLAAAIFVAAFTIIFEWQAGQPWPARARRIGEAVLLGLATGIAVMLVFEKVFYVRLP
jgi:putative tricarboxylic transport membrane protein